MSHARKHLVQQLEDDTFAGMEELRAGRVAVGRVCEVRGTHCEVDAPALGGRALVLVPARFRGVVWLRRGCFVALQIGDVPESTHYKLRATLLQLLPPAQQDAIRHEGLWPPAFDADAAATGGADTATAAAQKKPAGRYREEQADSSDDDTFGGGNPNRAAAVYFDSSDDEDDEDDEEDAL